MTSTAAASVSAAPTRLLGSFVRFTVCGGGVGLLSSGALVLADGRLPLAVANAVVAVVSTLLATELHARFAFAGSRPGRREHVRSALTAAVGYLFTTGALLALQALLPDARAWLTQAVYLAASALAGVARFAVLRAVVFAARPAAGPRKAVVRTLEGANSTRPDAFGLCAG
ncbi:hypothetical protein LG634_23085 [Streptomyces bambusae]|uniref:GtrA family protein n=1 Tax=Streptomyces bambusae TaxID=1550616 RepID=UPI001CFCCCD1|nr:GtrA family protein [Streptomyces bambusae]MCB5167703.1 hypothetical protein [Streptomyces bambusae]